MKPPPFSYIRPESVQAAVDGLAQWGEEAKVLAGGQSLVPLLNMRLARPTVVMDLSAIQGLDQIARQDGFLAIGAMSRQQVILRSPLVQESVPLLAEAVSHIGHLQIRNRGTIGGSLSHADPAAEIPAVSLALGAEMVIQGPRGERVVPAEGFFEAPFTTLMAADELLTEVRFPIAADERTVFLEFARRSGDFALAGVAAVVRLGDDGRMVEEVRISAFGVGGVPVRLTAAEAALRGRGLVPKSLQEAAGAASSEVEPVGDVHADADYRRRLVGVLLVRALGAVIQ